MNLSQFNRILRLVLIVPIAALLLMACGLFWQMRSAHTTVSLIQASGDDVAQAILIEKLIVDEETGLRGYQLTSDPHFLAPYNEAEAQLERNLHLLEISPSTTATGSANRTRQVQAVRSAQAAWRQGFAEPLIAIIKAGGNTNNVALNLHGRKLMDQLRSALDVVVQASQRREEVRAERWHSQARQTFYALGSLALLVGLIIGIFMRGLLHQVTAAFTQTQAVLQLRVEEAFQAGERLRTTLASIGDGVITCNVNGEIETMNAVAQELTGWEQVDAYLRPLPAVLRLVQESTREPVEDPIAHVRRNQAVAKLAANTVLIRKDGSEIIIDDSGAPIRDRSGELIGFVLVFRDVTMARKSQAALIANEKLAVSGRLAASIAHEIHNPLDSVTNLLYLMDESNGASTPEESARFLTLARQEITRVTQISRAMLGLYRESREPVPIDLRETLESVLLLLERRFTDLKIQLSAELPSSAIVHGFPAELRQVFTNLLTNAAEAAGQGGRVTVAVSPNIAAATPATPPGYLICIEDNGPGISDELRAKLFQPFFTTKGEQGTGLGLWVSRGIVVRHSGDISIESDTSPEHHGTSLRVFLATNPVIQAAPV